MKTIGYIIFHRHGHRTPIRNVFKRPEENDMWSTFLPSMETLKMLSELYPVKNLNEMPPFDVKSHPYGCITDKGLQHLYNIGAKAKAKFPLLNNPSNLKVFSTNYQRTQASAQSFLQGLGAKPGVPINVRDISQCGMSFYEGNADVARRVTHKVQQKKSFKELEEEIKDISEEILKAYPALARTDIDHDASLVSTSRINWMVLADYFAVRRANEIPYDSKLEPYAKECMKHLVKRYQEYYADEEFLREMIGPLLRDIITSAQEMKQANILLDDEVGEINPNPSVVIFSGHDVNILGILFALQAKLGKYHWPTYGSTFIVEINHTGIVPTKTSQTTVTASQTAGEDMASITDTIQSSSNVFSEMTLNFYYEFEPLFVRPNGTTCIEDVKQYAQNSVENQEGGNKKEFVSSMTMSEFTLLVQSLSLVPET